MASSNNTRISLARLATFLAKCKDTFALKSSLNSKQDKLKWDSTPTLNSANPVTSDGIMKALNKKQNSGNYQTKLTFDSTPTANSTNPVTSSGILTAINNVATKVNNIGTPIYKKPKTMKVLAGDDAGDYSKVIYSGQITLSESYRNFDALLILSKADEEVDIRHMVIPTYLLDYYLKVAKSFNNGTVAIMDSNSAAYWYISSSSTDTVFLKGGEHAAIIAVIGMKWE